MNCQTAQAEVNVFEVRLFVSTCYDFSFDLFKKAKANTPVDCHQN
jgi:hypothetical protein